MVNENITYYHPRKVIDAGEVVIHTKTPTIGFYKACSSVDKSKYVLAGILVKGSAELHGMDVTKRKDLESFVEAVGHCLFFFPAGGIVYKLPIKEAKELVSSYDGGPVKMNVNEVRSVLDSAGMELIGGIMTSMSFSPMGEL